MIRQPELDAACEGLQLLQSIVHDKPTLFPHTLKPHTICEIINLVQATREMNMWIYLVRLLSVCARENRAVIRPLVPFLVTMPAMGFPPGADGCAELLAQQWAQFRTILAS
jgi:hypothetical protein